jgi:hypothetical protein
MVIISWNEILRLSSLLFDMTPSCAGLVIQEMRVESGSCDRKLMRLDVLKRLQQPRSFPIRLAGCRIRRSPRFVFI